MCAGLKGRAWRGWQLRLAGWRTKENAWAVSGQHYVTRRLALGFGALLEGWREYQVRYVQAPVPAVVMRHG